MLGHLGRRQTTKTGNSKEGKRRTTRERQLVALDFTPQEV
jgi:hypothetical protein